MRVVILVAVVMVTGERALERAGEGVIEPGEARQAPLRLPQVLVAALGVVTAPRRPGPPAATAAAAATTLHSVIPENANKKRIKKAC